MSLEKKLESIPQLCNSLKEIKTCAENIWKTPLLPWFTNHDVSHSEEIIRLLGQILSPIEKSEHFLSEDELFILLASSYLHDIGMQNLKVKDI